MSKYTFFEYFPKIVNPWFGQKSDCFIKSFFFSTLALQKKMFYFKIDPKKLKNAENERKLVPLNSRS